MKKNRKKRRAEMKTLPQTHTKKVLTKEERKDHEYRLREKWTEQDTKELVKLVFRIVLIELFVLPLIFYFAPGNRSIPADDCVLVEFAPTNVFYRKVPASRFYSRRVVIDSNEGKYEISAHGSLLYEMSGMSVEELIDHLKSVGAVKAWVYKGTNSIIAMEAGTVSWSVQEINENMENNSIPLFAFFQFGSFFTCFCLLYMCGELFQTKGSGDLHSEGLSVFVSLIIRGMSDGENATRCTIFPVGKPFNDLPAGCAYGIKTGHFLLNAMHHVKRHGALLHIGMEVRWG